MTTKVEEFITKIRHIPDRVIRAKICCIGKNLLIKADDVADYLALIYKDMPEALRYARKRGMKASFPSFQYLEQLDKLFINKTFLNSLGLSLINMKELDILLNQICQTIADDERKINTILENR